MKPEHRGQEFSDFLDELGIRGEVEAQAIKEILADEIRAAMEKEGLTKKGGRPASGRAGARWTAYWTLATLAARGKSVLFQWG